MHFYSRRTTTKKKKEKKEKSLSITRGGGEEKKREKYVWRINQNQSNDFLFEFSAAIIKKTAKQRKRLALVDQRDGNRREMFL